MKNKVKIFLTLVVALVGILLPAGTNKTFADTRAAAPNKMNFHQVGGEILGYMRVKLPNGQLNYMITHEFVNDKNQQAYCLNSELPSPNGHDLNLIGRKGDEFYRMYKRGYNQSGNLNGLPVANTTEARYATQAVAWCLAGNFKKSDMVWNTPERPQAEVDRVHKAFDMIYDAAVNGKETTNTQYTVTPTQTVEKDGYHQFTFATKASHEGTASISLNKEIEGLQLVNAEGKEIQANQIPLNSSFTVKVPATTPTGELTLSSTGAISTVHAFEYGGNASIQNVVALVNVQDEHKVNDLKVNWKLAKGQIKALKVDEDGNPLTGAEFTLTDNEGNSVQAETSEEGLAAFDIEYGKIYKLEETKNPQGYKGEFVQEGITLENDGQVFDYTVKNELMKGTIQVKKVDEKGNALKGAEFTLTDNDGKTEKVVSDEKGIAQFAIVANKTYTLEETKNPQGYKGTFKQEGITLENDGQVFEYTVKNDLLKGLVKVLKVDEHGKPLKGAEFSLTDNDGKVQKAVSDDKGVAQFVIVANKTYKLEETKNPQGYKGAFKQEGITLKDDGQVFEYKVVNNKIAQTGSADHSKGVKAGVSLASLGLLGILTLVGTRRKFL